MTDFRVLCAELLDALEGYVEYAPVIDAGLKDEQQLVANARAALTQPEPQEPTDEELRQLADEYWNLAPNQECVPVFLLTVYDFARAAVARWGAPAIEPIPVAERLPEPGDCDARGKCWIGEMCNHNDQNIPNWELSFFGDLSHRSYSHQEIARAYPEAVWLPYYALPIPTDQED
jgi:hypothetical protein